MGNEELLTVSAVADYVNDDKIDIVIIIILMTDSADHENWDRSNENCYNEDMIWKIVVK